MSGNTFNEIFCVTTFGESHGIALGCVVDGCPAGLELSEDDIQIELDKRRPGQSEITTQRDEEDKVQILSGIFDGKTTGTPIAMAIFNQDHKSRDYDSINDIFRPAHADFTYDAKFGHRDFRGGGRASGRETAARVMAGAIALKILESEGIQVDAYVKSIYDIEAISHDVSEDMTNLIKEKKEVHDSVGGVIECQSIGLPAGIGSPVFDKLEARLAHALMSIGSVKGFEIGSGFGASRMLGSEHNDNIVGLNSNGGLEFEKNHCGGTLGGISTGGPLIVRAAFKPTSSIAQAQTGIDKDGALHEFTLEGRHDPCIVPRAVPIVRSMVALVLVDELLKQRLCCLT